MALVCAPSREDDSLEAGRLGRLSSSLCWQTPALSAPVIGGENVGLGLYAMLGKRLPDKFPDGGSIGTRKSQDGRSRAAQAYPENVRVPEAKYLDQARH